MMWLFAGMLCVPLFLNFAASRQNYTRFVDAFFISGVLCLIWTFTSVAAVIWPFPESKHFHPLVDLIGLLTVVLAYMTQRQKWKLTLAFLFLAQLATHAAFWWLRLNTSSGWVPYGYVAVLNVLWTAQLVCVGAPGGLYVLPRAFDHLRRRRSLLHLVRAKG